MNKRSHIFDRSLTAAIPIAFVLLWSTGWIVARLAADDADPLTFLIFRYAGAAFCLGAFAWLAGAEWPRSRAEWLHALASGVLLHALYLGGIWWAIAHGVPATISALLAALQPILTAILAPWLVGERIGPRQWLGVALGFAGLLLVLAPKLLALDTGQVAGVVVPLLINVAGMVSLTFGTFYQKRYIRTGDLRTISFLQFISAMLATIPLAYLFEDMRIVWSRDVIIAMVWSVVAVSIISIALLLHLIRRGEVARSAQLVYLVPPTAAVQAFLLFGERLSIVQLFGMAVTVTGVMLATRR